MIDTVGGGAEALGEAAVAGSLTGGGDALRRAISKIPSKIVVAPSAPRTTSMTGFAFGEAGRASELCERDVGAPVTANIPPSGLALPPLGKGPLAGGTAECASEGIGGADTVGEIEPPSPISVAPITSSAGTPPSGVSACRRDRISPSASATAAGDANGRSSSASSATLEIARDRAQVIGERRRIDLERRRPGDLV
jgi:hypothetical protein